MADKPIEIAPISRQEEGFVTLPYTKDQFRDFIQSLLGSPQSLSRKFRGSFEITRDTLLNVHKLLMQRLAQQNDGALIKFSASILFDNNSTVEFDSIESLWTYEETRPLVSVAVHLSWDFMVKFHDKRNPEKQNIQISFITSKMRSSGLEILGIDNGIFDYIGEHVRNAGFIHYRIEHTARTWGADIVALLDNFVESLISNNENTLRKIILAYKESIGFVIWGVLMSNAIGFVFFSAQTLSERQLQTLKKSISVSNQSIDMVNIKLDFITDTLLGWQWKTFPILSLVFLIVFGVGAALLLIWGNTLIEESHPAFILLSKESEKQKILSLKNEKSQLPKFFVANIFNIILGVISNYFFLWLTTR